MHEARRYMVAGLLCLCACGAPEPVARPPAPPSWPRQPAPQPATAIPLRADDPVLSKLAWMCGAWVADDAQGRTEEHWTMPSGATMLGVNRTVASGETVHYEQLRIERRGDAIFYVSSPVRQATTEFRLVESPEGDRLRAVFENPEHDFPKRIIYWRDAAGLHARVEGAPGDRSAEWLFRRAALDLGE